MNLHELAAPSRAAVIVVDMQNDFCDPAGATAQSGKSVQPMVEMAPRLRRLLGSARAAGVPVIFIQMLQTQWTKTKTWVFKGGDASRVPKCAAGTWGAEFYGVAPEGDEPVVVKHRYSAFVNTSLETILHTLGVTTLIMTGVATNVCVESTARDGFMKDYDIVFLSDCTATSAPALHEATLENIRGHFGRVSTSDELIATWSPQPVAV